MKRQTVEYWHIVPKTDEVYGILWYVLLSSSPQLQAGGQIMKEGFSTPLQARAWIERTFEGEHVILEHDFTVKTSKKKHVKERKRNPSHDLVERHTEFNFRPPRRVRMMKIPLDVSILKQGVFEIGKIPHVSYLSKKEGKLVEYVHEFKIPVKMFCTLNNGALLLVRTDGKPFDIRDWIYG